MTLVDINAVADATFDYVVVGGGTAGLTVAARLSENPDISVAVLDAGNPNIDDPLIQLTGHFGHTLMQPQYDWCFTTVPQALLNDREILWHRGKSLGGTSAMNFAAWTKPPKGDIDDWEALGNEGWNWDLYQKHNEQVMMYVPNAPGSEHDKYDDRLMKIWDQSWGKGPLKISHPKRVLDLQVIFQETFLNAGIPVATAPNEGEPNGCYVCPSTINPDTHDRSYAVTAFHTPNVSRPNLKILMGATVRRLLISGVEPNVTASGVEFSHGDSVDIYTVNVTKEVILCAGALKSPQILELSGIGRPDILKTIGVPVKIPLAGVGENVQDHNCLVAAYQLDDGVLDETYDLLRDPEMAAKHLELFKQKEGLHMISFTSFAFCPLSKVSPRVDELVARERERISREQFEYAPGLADQYELMLKKISNGACGYEFIMFPGLMSIPNPPLPGKKYVSIAAMNNYTFSRGSIHAKSRDPLVHPAFDPHYFEHDIDLEVLVDLLKYVRKLAQTAPLRDALVVELNPGPEAQSDEDIKAWFRNCMGSSFHVIGSCSMLPKEKNGVVDTRLKVYGTTNIRVADLSIAPLHFSAHAVATAYTIGEIAAAIITGTTQI